MLVHPPAAPQYPDWSILKTLVRALKVLGDSLLSLPLFALLAFGWSLTASSTNVGRHVCSET